MGGIRRIMLEQAMVKSRAWLSLSAAAMQTYLLLRCKCVYARLGGKRGKRGYEHINNGQLVFTYAEAKRLYGITAPRFSRAIDELVKKGFIDITATGMGVHKVETHYAISERWRDYETPSFQQAHRPERRIRCGFRKGNKLWQEARKKMSTDAFVHSAVHKNVHSPVLAMHTDVHGQKVVNRYIFCKDKGLCVQTA